MVIESTDPTARLLLDDVVPGGLDGDRLQLTRRRLEHAHAVGPRCEAHRGSVHDSGADDILAREHLERQSERGAHRLGELSAVVRLDVATVSEARPLLERL